MRNRLPRININGTIFIIDVVKEELREKSDPKNTINLKETLHDQDGYHFHYDSLTKNLAGLKDITCSENGGRVQLISMPNLTDFAPPVGISHNYTKTIDKKTGRTDPGLSIKEGSFFDLRWNKKILPTLSIAGHLFFVDIAAGKLRPKDDFKSKGISLEQISGYYDRFEDAYIIPYNPKTHEFQEIDHLKITELPKDIIVVKFPHHQELDRVGWNVKYGFRPAHCIREDQYQLHFKARTLPWEKTNIPNSIRLNLELRRIQDKIKPLAEIPPGDPLPIKKGRRL